MGIYYFAFNAGIGLNVNQTQADFDRLQLPYAGSLSLLAGGSLDRDHVARLLIAQLDKQYDRLVQGDLTTLETAWKLQTGLLDRHVIVECHDGTRRGVLSGLGFDGLLLTDARGSSTHLQPEAVKHVTALSGTRPDTWTEI